MRTRGLRTEARGGGKGRREDYQVEDCREEYQRTRGGREDTASIEGRREKV